MSSTRRKRTEKEALEYLNENASPISQTDRKSAQSRIRLAKQPNVEARRIVDQARNAKAGNIDVAEEIDFSDVQALWVQLVRRDGVVGSPHFEMLSALGRDIVTKGLQAKAFKKRAKYILSIESALPKETQKLEREFNRHRGTGNW